jgi:SEC-C motif-containing protein
VDAFVAASQESQESPVILARPVILEPPGDGTSIDMVEACRGFAERWPGCTFAFDEKAGGQQLLQRPEREFPECRHIPFPQDPRPLCDASMRFAELVAARKLRHPDHPQLTDHVLAASARFVGERWRFARPKGRHRWTDGLTAASIAVSLVGRVEEVTPFVWTIVPEDEDDWPGAGVGVILRPDIARLDRNDPCHCGSGKKFKRCHSADREAAKPAPPPYRPRSDRTAQVAWARALVRGYGSKAPIRPIVKLTEDGSSGVFNLGRGMRLVIWRAHTAPTIASDLRSRLLPRSIGLPTLLLAV